jgi:lipopolysaccharide transport system ATP-binding protein
MPEDVVIRVENLSKKYIIRHQGRDPGYGLRHTLQDAITAPFRVLKRKASLSGAVKSENGAAHLPNGHPGDENSPGRMTQEEFWALRDVSLEVKRGEVIGIIGRNGAGKSTLLKILSRITEPSEGRVGIKGRVASLLEVGTGFHPELTGRENIFLNGAILGMAREEVKRKFDEIIDFAGVEKFIDTPVKRFSNGMYVRLAFAVAAHLEPEILIVDEVLAVGDIDFQEKCIGKMQSVASGQGRTVFFVSHQLESVMALCTRVCMLESGRMIADGNPDTVVQTYKKRRFTDTASADGRPITREGSGSVHITRVAPAKGEFDPSEPKVFDVEIETRDRLEGPFYLALVLLDHNRTLLMMIDTRHAGRPLIPGDPIKLTLVLKTPWLCPGEYSIDAQLYSWLLIDRWEDACKFNVSSRLPYPGAINELHIKTSAMLPDFSFSIGAPAGGTDIASVPIDSLPRLPDAGPPVGS